MQYKTTFRNVTISSRQSNQYTYNTTKLKHLMFNTLSVYRKSKLLKQGAEKNIKLYSSSINEHVTVKNTCHIQDVS